MRPHSARALGTGLRRSRPAEDAVLSAAPRMRPGTVVGCCVSLLVAGILLARGFVGVLPSRPVYVALGGVLAATALLGLVIDHVSVRVRPDRPDQILVGELERSRRHGHALTLVTIACTHDVGLEVVTRLRTTDRAWRARGVLVVMLVETARPGAVEFLARLGGLVTREDVRVASFPTDAVTVDGLFDALARPHQEPADADDAGVRLAEADPDPEVAELAEVEPAPVARRRLARG